MLPRVHALLIGMLPRHPDLILDACSLRAKRGDGFSGPNLTDRTKRGTKYYIAVDGEGVPLACAVTANNVHDARLRAPGPRGVHGHGQDPNVFADKGYNAEQHRTLCQSFAAELRIQ
ncbi:MAG: family transposase [Rhodospirillales bacterium]|nr:family transposase [Rhodospirillales bacterium]